MLVAHGGIGRAVTEAFHGLLQGRPGLGRQCSGQVAQVVEAQHVEARGRPGVAPGCAPDGGSDGAAGGVGEQQCIGTVGDELAQVALDHRRQPLGDVHRPLTRRGLGGDEGGAGAGDLLEGALYSDRSQLDGHVPACQAEDLALPQPAEGGDPGDQRVPGRQGVGDQADLGESRDRTLGGPLDAGALDLAGVGAEEAFLAGGVQDRS